MSTSCVSFRSEFDNDYAVDSRGSFEKISKQNRRPQYRRSSTPPGSVNGIHMRRKSRWTWGHGRSAQAQNLRAFARCALAAFTAFWATAASAGIVSIGSSTIDLVPIGNPNNVANPSAPSNVAALGGGSVGYSFEIASTEVTNAQYATFLNSVARVADTNALWNASMQITRSGSAGSFNYAPTGSNANRPVQFVSFRDTFRFANWLQNGMPNTGSQTPGTTENGTYDMSLSLPTRQVGARYWIPSVNEWYKAAFFNPTLNGSGGYTLFPVNSNSMVASTPSGTSISANFNNVVGTTTAVGAYTSAMSFYGVFDMAGNLAERLDTPTGATYFSQQSSYVGVNSSAASNQSGAFTSASLNGENATTGFRIAAVPEPSTVVLAGMGIASGLIGFIRKKAAASRARG